MFKSVVSISVGASLGALLRWVLGTKLNAVFAILPFGTLSANLIAGYTVGLASAYFASAPNLSPEWRLLIITGFCGGLSTFSTFSSEIVSMLQRGQWTWAASSITVHVFGSLLMTLAGILTWQLVQGH